VFLGSTARQVRAVNLTAICEPSVRISVSHNLTILHGLLSGYIYSLYVDVRTSQEIHLLASTACYGVALLFYV
jgi:hypothetical protein